MHKNLNSQSSLIQLYNPKQEGLGNYDINYINAYKKYKDKKIKSNQINNERQVA